MTTLEFKDNLTVNKFTYHNEYVYIELAGTGIVYKESETELPFIMRSTYIGGGLVHKEGEIVFSSHQRQLRGRAVTTSKIKEILNTARMPILIRSGLTYLIGKGFLACYTQGEIEVLFLATSKKTDSNIEKVKFYISRSVYSTRFKKIQPIIKDLMAVHKGDIIITSNISNYVGSRIPLPIFKSIKEEAKYKDLLFDYCIKEHKKVFMPVKVKFLPEDPKKVKKDKEAEILEAIRHASLGQDSQIVEFLESRRSEIEAEVAGIQANLPQVEGYVTTDHAEGDMMYSSVRDDEEGDEDDDIDF